MKCMFDFIKRLWEEFISALVFRVFSVQAVQCRKKWILKLNVLYVCRGYGTVGAATFFSPSFQRTVWRPGLYMTAKGIRIG